MSVKLYCDLCGEEVLKSWESPTLSSGNFTVGFYVIKTELDASIIHFLSGLSGTNLCVPCGNAVVEKALSKRQENRA